MIQRKITDHDQDDDNEDRDEYKDVDQGEIDDYYSPKIQSRPPSPQWMRNPLSKNVLIET